MKKLASPDAESSARHYPQFDTTDFDDAPTPVFERPKKMRPVFSSADSESTPIPSGRSEIDSTLQDIGIKREKRLDTTVVDHAQPEKKKTPKKELERRGDIVYVGDKEVDLTLPTNPSLPFEKPWYPARGRNLLIFGYGKSNVFVLYKEGAKLMLQTKIGGKENSPVHLKTGHDIINAIGVFKGNVQFNYRSKEPGIASATEDDDTEIPAQMSRDADELPPTPDLVVPLRPTNEPPTGGREIPFSENQKVELGMAFDDLIDEHNAPEVIVEKTRSTETAAGEIDMEATVVTPEEKAGISELVAALSEEGYDAAYYKEGPVEDFPSRDEKKVRVGSAGSIFGTSSTGGKDFVYSRVSPVERESVEPLRSNYTAIVSEVASDGTLSGAVTEASTAKALRASQDILRLALREQDHFTLEAAFGATHQIAHGFVKPGDCISVAATTLDAKGQVTFGSWGDTGVLMIRDGKQVSVVDQAEVTPIKAESKSVEVDPQIEMRSVTGKDHDQVIQATKQFWKLVTVYEVEKLSKRYRGQALEKALFNLATERNNATKDYTIEEDVGVKVTKIFRELKPESFAIQVVHVELPEQRGILSKIASSKVGKWLRGAALVAFGLSGTGEVRQAEKPVVQGRAVEPQAGPVRTLEHKVPGMVAFEVQRDNEAELVHFVNERNKELKMLGKLADDKGRIVWVAAVLKQLLRGKDTAGFKTADLTPMVKINPEKGTFEFTNVDQLDELLGKIAEASKHKKHIKVVKGYAAGVYKDAFK